MKKIDRIGTVMKEIYIIYSPLFLAGFILFLGFNIYCVHKYGDLRNNSIYDKYKLSPNNILIRLKLFKYNNNFNLILLIPYFITIGLFVIILILYIIYWCGVTILEEFFKNRWVIITLFVICMAFMGYSGLIDQMIAGSGGWDAPDFSIDNETTKDEKENAEKDIKKD